MLRLRTREHWTNSVSNTLQFGLDELVDAGVLDKGKGAMSDPEWLRPDETRQTLGKRFAGRAGFPFRSNR